MKPAKKAGLAVLSALAIVALVVIVQQLSPKKEGPLVAWNIYNGEYGAYNVVIDESQHKGETMLRMIHLEPLKGYDAPEPMPFAVTGHDFDSDGQMDRVFIRGNGGLGYNSVRFLGNGTRAWEPCMGNKDTVAPFTDDEVNSAQELIYGAMAAVHNPAHRTQTLESYRADELRRKSGS